MDKFNCSAYDISDSVESMLADGAVLPLYVSGSSMNPFLISRRDIVYLRASDGTDLRKGNIVLFKRSNGTLVLHRVRKVLHNGRVVMNGDAQKWCETIERSQVLATVFEIERKGMRKNADSFYWIFLNAVWRTLFPLRSLLMRLWFRQKRIKNKTE